MVSVARDFCGGAACCAALSSGSAWRGLREKVFGRRMASAVSSRASVRGSANTGLNVKKRRKREWLWKQRAAMPAALWSAPSVSALTCVAGHSFSSARVASCRSSASFLERDRSSVQSVGRPMHPKCGSQPPTTALPHLPRRLKFRSSATASSAASARLHARPRWWCRWGRCARLLAPAAVRAHDGDGRRRSLPALPRVRPLSCAKARVRAACGRKTDRKT